jgi:ATP-dependent helicase/nuclease subunit B
MSAPARVFSIPAGAPFLPTLCDALAGGHLVPGFGQNHDPLALADPTIYVPTRRAARALRSLFVDRAGGRAAILPVIRPLGEFDEDAVLFESGAASLELAPPIASVDRVLFLTPLVRAWKRRLPAHVAALFEEDVVVPASTADAVWLARDLAGLMDEVETEGGRWDRLADLVSGELAGWWQVTLDFLEIVTQAWPAHLAQHGMSNPGAHRDALIRAEAARLARNPPPGPVIAAGSTGSIPATAELLGVIARLPQGAVVLPGLDCRMDQRSWAELTSASTEASVPGHPQFGLAKLLGRLGVQRADVAEIGERTPALAMRATVIGEALRPAETTDGWAAARKVLPDEQVQAAFESVSLVEAANEREEALAIATALRLAIEVPDRTAGFVTTDRELARRVSAELLRFGIRADDSGGTPLARTPPAEFMRLLLLAALRPGDPVALLSFLKHPLLSLGLERALVRRAAETIELVALRGGTGRPDVADLGALFEARLSADAAREPFWVARITGARIEEARKVLAALAPALSPLVALRGAGSTTLADALRATVAACEAAARGPDGNLSGLYGLETGETLAGFLRGLVASPAALDFSVTEWPELMDALIAPEVVKPSAGAEHRIAIWGALEARLQTVDTLVIGGLNEGSWPRKAEADRFMSRLMKSGLDLEPPERRIGQAAHDFQIAMGAPNVVLTRAARAGESPAVESRWLQRLRAFAGARVMRGVAERGDRLLGWARRLDEQERVRPVARPEPKPPLTLRPAHFSVTEIETLRRDPYAIYARKVLGLQALEPLLRDPGAAERGNLFHAILHRFSAMPRGGDMLAALVSAARECFAEAALPPDVEAVWWPRFVSLSGPLVEWERRRDGHIAARHSELAARATPVGTTGVTLSGRADRIDTRPAGHADILDYKTGSGPSKGQAHTLLSPQLALEGALLRRGAFREIGTLEPADLAYIRLKGRGELIEESILTHNQSTKSAIQLSEEAWARLEALFEHYRRPETGYLSRAIPFREGETDGDYDHLARVLEWSAGGDGPEAEADE